LPLLAWLLVYPPRILSSHFRLATNAYDLSVFDYALWSTLQGRLGDVPFIGHSLFSHHFMPTLLALLPLYAWWQSPVFLIAVQLCAVVAAAVLLHRLLAPRVSSLIAGALLTAFLFSRRTHSAATSVFYI
jgi:uncharacterized membrane protein